MSCFSVKENVGHGYAVKNQLTTLLTNSNAARHSIPSKIRYASAHQTGNDPGADILRHE